ncbi:6-hydroxymethylpterin diphosphokinase MptE-like protein [Spirosoma oryzicola]|uniref:6-hydroxymethylpterin diphosphokinase MptE-like protein n=1 Tax=Spirosoma oryzicola TaxID=2898794 RepID=UPI001E2D3A2E|nr:6-hydroxymethylpterin diphosphokinase MptE-like protein [Spirosoma oryzicola]UHG92239.1 DUF115 domain-containing protein [Spirosoma oryzicola]
MEKLFNYEPENTVNPYRLATSLIAKRIKWDLDYRSWVSRARLKKLHNQYTDKKAVIICNGPSLRKVDLDKYIDSDVYFFGLNKLNLLFDEIRFRPNCFIASNYYVIEQNRDFFNSTDIQLFLNADKANLIDLRKNVAFIKYCAVPRKFARDCSVSLFQGHTVTYTAMQLAFHMGFQKVALIGCDHYFETKGPSNKTVKAGESDPNHFHPKYFADGVKWDLPDLLGSEYHYDLANQIYKNYGRQLYNCTDGGSLEVFERISLDKFINL